MKTIPLLVALLWAWASRADVFTCSFTNAGSATFTVPANTLAEVISMYTRANTQFIVSTGNAVAVETNGSPYFFQNIYCPTVVGPASITITNGTPPPIPNMMSFFVVRTSPAVTLPTAIPSTAVVIPSDTNGPVNIILESSSDLVNWVGALPGTYGTTYSNRFFRVRASR